MPTTAVEVTTTTANPWAVPAVADLPYVQRVLQTIYGLDGDAVRYAYTHKIRDGEVDARLVAIFGGPALEEARQVLDKNASEGFARLADPPGNAEVCVIDIVQATPTCMVVRANLDFGPYYNRIQELDPQSVVQLRTARVQVYNPTGWGVIVAGQPDAGTDLRVCG